mmetsp:Transcript_22682/g.29998  ORF Transcript_22682/g.29998 Transcript_22682/m.29998 type:complete len:90 (+) Transcript_22682:478-747(+)
MVDGDEDGFVVGDKDGVFDIFSAGDEDGKIDGNGEGCEDGTLVVVGRNEGIVDGEVLEVDGIDEGDDEGEEDGWSGEDSHPLPNLCVAK